MLSSISSAGNGKLNEKLRICEVAARIVFLFWYPVEGSGRRISGVFNNKVLTWQTALFFSLLRIALKICPGTLGQRKSAPSGLAGEI